MADYISREAVFQVVHGIARGIATKDIEALKAKDTKTFYKIKGAKEILDSVDTDLCYVPVADVQPVKRGRWICEFYNDLFDVYQADCSVCKKESTDKYDKVSESYEYCPHCGARMDGEQNEVL